VKKDNNRFSRGLLPRYRPSEITSCRGCLIFFILPGEPYSPNGKDTWTIMPESTQIFSRKCLLEVPRFTKKILGSYLPAKIEKIFNHCTSMKFLNNF
jgi:hypothetical protein